jgi:hypothetical protein
MATPPDPDTEVKLPSPSTAPTKRIGFTEFLDAGSLTFKRRVGALPWLPVSVSPAENVPSTATVDFARPDWWTLFLVRFYQFPEEPLHWSLVISPTDDPGPLSAPYVSSVENQVLRRTFILEVRGEPEQMFYNEVKEYKHVSLLEDVHSIYELVKFGVDFAGTKEDTFDMVRSAAKETECPKARNRREATENCQGWCVRVVERLVKKGVVSREKTQMMRDMLDSVNPVW